LFLHHHNGDRSSFNYSYYSNAETSLHFDGSLNRAVRKDMFASGRTGMLMSLISHLS